MVGCWYELLYVVIHVHNVLRNLAMWIQQQQNCIFWNM